MAFEDNGEDKGAMRHLSLLSTVFACVHFVFGGKQPETCHWESAQRTL